jgi:hypothetical protein
MVLRAWLAAALVLQAYTNARAWFPVLHVTRPCRIWSSGMDRICEAAAAIMPCKE